MKKVVFIIFSWLITLCPCSAQQWMSLGGGMPHGPFNWEVRTIFADTSSGLIYAGGNFNYAGNIQGFGIAVWDGTKWDSLGSGCARPVARNLR